MPLKAGEIAPHFLMKDTSGQMIDLAHYRGSRTMLSFFRYTGCPLCNLRFWYLTQRYPHYRAQGLRIISVFESSQADTRDFASKFASPFPIIADPKRELYKLYKLETSWTGFVRGFLLRGAAFEEAQSRGLAKWNINGTAQRMPADFLLNPDQTIATAYYGKDMGDFLQLTQIDDFLSQSTTILDLTHQRDLVVPQQHDLSDAAPHAAHMHLETSSSSAPPSN